MRITKEMVVELNSELAVMGCPFRYKFIGETGILNNTQIEITLPSMNHVSSFIIHPTTEFFAWLVSWFELKGIDLSCNNDRSILWSKSGWDLNN